MELRKTVKRPQRFEPELSTYVQRTNAPRSTRPSLPMPFVDYNPDLPPAAFPTLEIRTAIEHTGLYQSKSKGITVPRSGREGARNEQRLLSNEVTVHSGDASDCRQDGLLITKRASLDIHDVGIEEETLVNEMISSEEEGGLDSTLSEVGLKKQDQAHEYGLIFV